MNINSYNWNELYKQANEFIEKNIPPAKVNTGCMCFLSGHPRVEIFFIAKGNKNILNYWMKCPVCES